MTSIIAPYDQVLQEWASVQDYIQWKVFEWPFDIAQGTSQHVVLSHTYHKDSQRQSDTR